MICFFLIIFLLCLYQIKFSRKDFQNDFLGIDQATCIKGIFILFVFFRHILSYIRKSGYDFSFFGDIAFKAIDVGIGQLMVVMFLFYSGYGIKESFSRKGYSYVKAMPKHRILPTLLNFDIAVICFLLIDLYFDISFSRKELLLSIIGWENLGNSNWYIFDILLCYSLAFLSFYFSKHHLATLSIGIILSIILLAYLKPSWWSNTLLSFAGGVFFSEYKAKIVDFLKKHYWATLSSLLLIFLCIYETTFIYKQENIFWICLYNIASILFAMLIVLASMKIKISNKPLFWLGKNLFSLYIYQRIPMILFFEISPDFVKDNTITYIIICILLTGIIAHFYKYWQVKINP